MVIWSKTAVRDLRAIHNFIASDSPYYAKKVAADIRTKADMLQTLPKSGRQLPEVKSENIRELFLYSYRIIYETRAQNILILTIVHKRRNLLPADVE